jgi:ubiquinol-cytochrome c reductase cytochrome b subunit
MSDASPAAPPEGPRPPATPRDGLLGWLERRVNLTELFSFVSHFGLIYTPVDTTQPLSKVLADLGRQPVPAFARGARSLGLLAAILFGLQAVTGVLLAYYYRPTPEAAYESTRMIVRDLPFGWLLHQMHAWGAQLLIVVVMLRLLRLFWDGLYRAPRELLWWSAVALAWFVTRADFTGRLLTWDAQSYWTTVRGIEVGRAVPLLGGLFSFLIGGKVVDEEVLIRFYVLHILVLPLAVGGLLYLTIATIRRVGLSPPSTVAPHGTTTLRDHLYGTLIIALLMFGALASLAVLLPKPFLGIADPYATPSGVGPPWYFLAPFVLVQRMPGPAWLYGALVLAVSLAVLLLPLWLKPVEDLQGRRRIRVAGVVLVGAWVALTIAGAVMGR